MSIEQIFSDGCRDVAAAFHDLAAAIRYAADKNNNNNNNNNNMAGALSPIAKASTAELVEATRPTTAKGAVEEAKAKAQAAADKKAQEEAAKVAAEIEAKEKAAEAVKAKQAEAGAADVPDYNEVVYPKLLGLVNAKGKDAWLKLADEFKNEAGVAPAKGANVDPKDYARLVARIDEIMGEGEV